MIPIQPNDVWTCGTCSQFVTINGLAPIVALVCDVRSASPTHVVAASQVIRIPSWWTETIEQFRLKQSVTEGALGEDYGSVAQG